MQIKKVSRTRDRRLHSCNPPFELLRFDRLKRVDSCLWIDANTIVRTGSRGAGRGRASIARSRCPLHEGRIRSRGRLIRPAPIETYGQGSMY